MTTDLPLWQQSGAALRDAGIARVLAHNEPYSARFHAAAALVIAEAGEVTSDAVVQAIGMPDGSPNAVGACMRSFAQANRLRVAGYRKSTRPSCHAAIVAVWRSEI